jgi:hypothetical protein
MSLDDLATAQRVSDEAGRRQVVEVLHATYHREKRWVADPETQAPASDLDRADMSWFVVAVKDQPAGVLRVLYDPPLAQYARYGFKALDPAIRVEEFVRDNRIAEIGRFAVIPKFRGQFMIAAALMRAAAQETVMRGCSHFVTDVFEDDPHSPYGFHTRVMGFRPVATHEAGELHCASRRITLVLDIRAAYQRLRTRGSWLFRYLTARWDMALHRQLAS